MQGGITLQGFLALFVAGGSIIGAAVYWIMDTFDFFKNLQPAPKRFVSLALSAALPVLAWVIMLIMGYDAAPATWQGWIERIFALALTPILVSQGVHGLRDLRQRPAA